MSRYYLLKAASASLQTDAMWLTASTGYRPERVIKKLIRCAKKLVLKKMAPVKKGYRTGDQMAEAFLCGLQSSLKRKHQPEEPEESSDSD